MEQMPVPSRMSNCARRRPLEGLCRAGLSVLLVTFLLAGCGGEGPGQSQGQGQGESPAPKGASSGPASIRLVDQLQEAEVVAEAPAPEEAAPVLEWRFDQPPEGGGAEGEWSAAEGVSDLAPVMGGLNGLSESEFPLIQAPIACDEADFVHSVEIRMQVQEGGSLGIAFQGGEQPDLEALHGPGARFFTAPLAAGDEIQTYTVRIDGSLALKDLRYIFFRPTDAANMEFLVESIWIVTLKERLRAASAGVVWHEFAGVSMESIGAVAPVTMNFSLKVPENPWLDLAVGTLEQEPVTFRITAAVGDGASEPTLEQAAAAPGAWEWLRVDLSAYAGKEIKLGLELASDKQEALGFWGSPVVRNRGAQSAVIAEDGEAPRGVVLVVADGIRRDHLEAYGYQRDVAPALARLASEGVLFKDCISQAVDGAASIPSILTSLYPATHTVRAAGDRLPAAADTLAEQYRAVGCATVALLSGPCSGSAANLHHGFETVYEWGGKRTPAECVVQLRAWLQGRGDVPFFAFVHLGGPRYPFSPAGGQWADPGRKQEYEQEAAKAALGLAGGMPARQALQEAGIDAEAFAAYSADLYDECVREVDDQLGLLLDHLTQLGLKDQTVLAVVGSYGMELWDHGGMPAGRSVYGELANVPLVLAGPAGWTPGAVVDETVASIDLMPTLLEVSGLEIPEGAQGQSLLPLISSPGALGLGGYPVVTEAVDMSGSIAWDLPETDAVVLDGWKLVAHFEPGQSEPDLELYHHREDPLDQTNLAAGNAERVEALRAEFDGWQERADSVRLVDDSGQVGGGGGGDREDLRSLPYTGSLKSLPYL